MKGSNNWQNKFSLVNLDIADSTNNEAKRLVAKSPSKNFVIKAERQTDGRGRYGKKWDSIDGNLFMSIILPCTAPLDIMAQISFVTSLAIGNAITELSKGNRPLYNIELKWPNDVLLNDKKVAGILLEAAGKTNEYLVIGVGVNIKNSPDLKDYNATSLIAENLLSVDASEMLNVLMKYFDKYYQLWEEKDFLSIREKWLKCAKNLRKEITIDTGKSKISGIFLDIDFNGAIRLQLKNGEIRKIHSGEVYFGE